MSSITHDIARDQFMLTDKHPSAHIDVNAPTQMFEEFYETYDVQEGDGKDPRTWIS